MDKGFYNRALRYMDNIRALEPTLADARDAECCILQTDKGTVYGAITSVKISNGHIMTSCPEFGAIMTMVPEGESRVNRMVTISFARKTVSQPCESCLQLLVRINQENLRTQVLDGANHAVPVADLLGLPLPDPTVETTAVNAEQAQMPAQEAVTDEAPAAAASAAEEIPVQNEFAAEAPAAEEIPVQNEFAAEAPAAGEIPVQNEFAAEAPAAGEVPVQNEFAAEAPAAEEIPVQNEFAAEAPETEAAPVMEAEPAPEEKPEPMKPVSSGVMSNEEAQSMMAGFTGDVDADNPMAQFGFEVAELAEQADEELTENTNPFYDAPINPDSDAALPPHMRQNTQPRYMSERPQSQNMPSQQSTQYASQPMPGQQMYASQARPGQMRHPGGGTFRPGQSISISQPMAQSQQTNSFQPGMQGTTFRPVQQPQQANSFQPGMQGNTFRPGQQNAPQSQQMNTFQPGQQNAPQSQQVNTFQPGQQNAPQFQQMNTFQPGQQKAAQSQQMNTFQPGQQNAPQSQQMNTFQPGQQGNTFRPGQQNVSQSQQVSSYQAGAQYASQRRPGTGTGSRYLGSQYLDGQSSQYTGQSTVAQSGYGTQTAPKKGVGSAFRQRLSAFMNDENTPANQAAATEAELKRLAKEKKKAAKIDADFRKQMKKRGF
ncbi:MAG: hypothetical protein IJ595_10230 [Oscillospiraceae bacterium]|nr:hypothetical protein [Oscillospiraceae bacterium]